MSCSHACPVHVTDELSMCQACGEVLRRDRLDEDEELPSAIGRAMPLPTLLEKARAQLAGFNATRYTERNHPSLHPELVTRIATFLETGAKLFETDSRKAAIHLLGLIAEYEATR